MSYVEEHSALTSRFVAWLLIAPNAALVLLLLLGILGHQWAIAAPLLGVVGYLLLVTWTMVYRNWPTGIQIGADGVRVGAVTSRRAERRTRKIGAVHEAWGLFRCPWEGVLSITVIADRNELDRIRHSVKMVAPTNRWGKPIGSRLHKGVLTAPFMRAALVVQVDPTWATVPGTYASRFYNNASTDWQDQDPGIEGAIWVVPTRRAQKLQQIIQQSPAFHLTGPVAAWAPTLHEQRHPRKYHL